LMKWWWNRYFSEFLQFSPVHHSTIDPYSSVTIPYGVRYLWLGSTLSCSWSLGAGLHLWPSVWLVMEWGSLFFFFATFICDCDQTIILVWFLKMIKKIYHLPHYCKTFYTARKNWFLLVIILIHKYKNGIFYLFEVMTIVLHDFF
jgi:hypothetical protein